MGRSASGGAPWSPSPSIRRRRGWSPPGRRWPCPRTQRSPCPPMPTRRSPAPTAAGSRCQGASVPQRRARPELPLWCFRPHTWGRVGGAEVFLSIYTYIDTHIYVFMVQTSELTRPSLPPPCFPSTLKKKLRLSGDFFCDLNIYISTLVFFPSLVWGGFIFSCF